MTPKRRTARQLGLLAMSCYGGGGNPVGDGAGLRAGCSGRASRGAGGIGRHGGSNGHGHHRRNEHADVGTVGYRGDDQRGGAGNRSHGSALTGAAPNPCQ